MTPDSNKSKFIEWTIDHPVTVSMLFVVIFIIGLVCFQMVPVELSPNIELPKLTVHVSWRNTSAVTMESRVTAPLEAAIQGIKGITYIFSRTYEGYCYIALDFEKDADLDLAELELNEKISQEMQELPEGVSWPNISRSIPRELRSLDGFMRFQLIGEKSTSELRQFAEEKLLNPLSSIQGVDDVEIWGGAKQVLKVSINPALVQQFHVSQAELNTLQRQLNSYDVRLGSIAQNGVLIDIKLNTNFASIDEIKNILVKNTTSGRKIKLQDIAEVYKDFDELQSIVRYNGKNLVLISLSKEPGANLLKTAQRVEKEMEIQKQRFPDWVQIVKIEDFSQELRDELQKLSNRSIFSILFIAIVLFIVFRNIKAVFIILSSIFFAILGAISLFYILGYTLNILTLAGFTIGFGLLVDNAIVVYDNISRKLSEVANWSNKSIRKTAIVNGVEEMVQPLLASNLTTIGAFIPVFFLSPKLQIYFAPFALALGLTIVISLFISFTLIPTFAYHRIAQPMARESKTEESFSGYQKFLAFCMSHRGWTLFIVIWLFGFPIWLLPDKIEQHKKSVYTEKHNIKIDSEKTTNRKLYEQLLAGKAVIADSSELEKIETTRNDKDQELSFWVKKYNDWWGNHFFTQKVKPILFGTFGGASYRFFRQVPKSASFERTETTYIDINVRINENIPIHNINQICLDFEQYLLKYQQQLSKVNSWIYSNQRAYVHIEFKKEFENSAFPLSIYQRLVQIANNNGAATIGVNGFGEAFGTGGTANKWANYGAKISGTNYQRIYAIAGDIAEELQKNRRIQNVDLDNNSRQVQNKKEIFCGLNKQRLYQSGLNNQWLSSLIQNYLRTESTVSTKINGQMFNTIIRQSGDSQLNAQTINQNIVNNQFNVKPVRLSQLMNIQKQKVLPSIERGNQQYRRMVTYDYIGPIGHGYKLLDIVLEKIKIPYGYVITPEDSSGRLDEKQTSELLAVIGLSILIVFLISAALFESFTRPLLILLAIPLSVIGLFYSFYFFSAVFDRGGYASILLLVGIVVNNSIILVKHIVDEISVNGSSISVITNAASHRVRPILMTSLTTIVGLLPLVLYESTESIWYPLAVGTIGGLLLSSVLILVVVPVCFEIR